MWQVYAGARNAVLVALAWIAYLTSFPQVYEIARKAACFAPAWIAANWSFNASLCLACGRCVVLMLSSKIFLDIMDLSKGYASISS